MATEPTYRCGTCGSQDISGGSTYYTHEWLSESDGIRHTEPTGSGSMSVKCCRCGRSISALFSTKHPSKKYPRQSIAFDRMMTALEGRSRRSRWAKCITEYQLPHYHEKP